MTIEEFKLLSRDDQDAFIAKDGVITPEIGLT